MKILLNYHPKEQAYLGAFNAIAKQFGFQVKTIARTCTLDQLQNAARVAKCEGIVVANSSTLKNLVADRSPSLTDWRGSILSYSIPAVVTLSIASIRTTALGKLHFRIDLKKLQTYRFVPRFKYSYSIARTPAEAKQATKDLQKADALAIDIETDFHNRITSVAFTEITNNWKIGKTWTIEANSVEAWEAIRTLCRCPAIKIFHNGAFDTYHLLRVGIAVTNYWYDTEYIMHCWLAMLKKSLAYCCSLFLHDFYYWKHEAELSPLEYNAKDTINTARLFIFLAHNAPLWVWKNNYPQEFLTLAPIIYTAFEGMLVDTDKLASLRAKAATELTEKEAELRVRVADPNFNYRSPQQVSTFLYSTLRLPKPSRAKSESATGEKELKRLAASSNVLVGEIISLILKCRELAKAISTYYDCRLTEDNRLLYFLKCDGTQSGRMACNASSLYAPPPPGKSWVKSNMKNYGTQLQNIPPYMKKALRADPGYRLGNIDKSQSEARCVAHLSRDPELIKAIEDPQGGDFYCYTGYRFFGIEFGKDHPLRQIVKKIIHGTNYMMQENTFIDSVGVETMRKYKAILKRPISESLKHFAGYLLSLYHKPFSRVKVWWGELVTEALETGKLVTPDGWVLKVFGNPEKNSNLKRSLVSHKPQHWSVWGINKAFWKLFYEVQVPSKGEYRLKGQIHDSIVYQAKEEKFDFYEQRTLEIMDIPQPYDGGVMHIPLDTESGIYWKED